MRIDLVLSSGRLASHIQDAYIDREARKGKLPSDHAPVVVDVADTRRNGRRRWPLSPVRGPFERVNGRAPIGYVRVPRQTNASERNSIGRSPHLLRVVSIASSRIRSRTSSESGFSCSCRPALRRHASSQISAGSVPAEPMTGTFSLTYG
jgi:hypothetical protein